MFSMRWYALVPLLADSRVNFLLGFVIVAVIIAGILTFLEFRLRKRKEKHLALEENQTPVIKLRRYMKSTKTPREKLDFIDKVAKEYFKEHYNSHLNSSYSSLISDFEKHKKIEEAAFCKAMFETYYSSGDLSEGKPKILADLLIKLILRKERTEEVVHIPTFFEKVDSVFTKLIDKFIDGATKRMASRNIKKIEKKIIDERKKVLERISLKSSFVSEIPVHKSKKISPEKKVPLSKSENSSSGFLSSLKNIDNKIEQKIESFIGGGSNKEIKSSVLRPEVKKFSEPIKEFSEISKINSESKGVVEKKQLSKSNETLIERENLRLERIAEKKREKMRARELKERNRIKKREIKLARREKSRLARKIIEENKIFLQEKKELPTPSFLIGSKEWMRRIGENLEASLK